MGERLGPMSDPRIIHVELDEQTILWRNADIEQERRIAIFDLIEDNFFKPLKDYPDVFLMPRHFCSEVRCATTGGGLSRSLDLPFARHWY